MEPNSSEDDYFKPLGIRDSFGRAIHILRQRWKHILVVSAIPVFLWYIIAIGIRRGFDHLSSSHVEYRSFEMGNGEIVTYPVATHSTTFSRLGLVVEFVLFCFLFLPANAMNLRTIAGLYAGEGGNFLQTARAVLPIMPSLGLVCTIWCTILMLPLLLIILCMAPEGMLSPDGSAIYYKPWLPKLVFGIAYLIASSAFMLATYLSYSILVVKGGQAIASLKESFELFKTSWPHIGAVVCLWFLIKVLITKVVTAINWLYYLHEWRFWTTWDQPGIPLHPIRILWSESKDLWQIGRSKISVPFVIFLVAMGSIFQAVLYVDTRVKQGSYTRTALQNELAVGDNEQRSDYKTMENATPTNGGAMA